MSQPDEKPKGDPGEALRKALYDVAEEIERRSLPEAPVLHVHSDDIAEDGKTRVLMIDLVDGGTFVISICPGEPLRGMLAH